MKIILFLIIFICLNISYSQSENQKKNILDSYSNDKIDKVNNEITSINKERKRRVNNFIVSNPNIKFKYKKDAKIYILYDVLNNEPIYRVTTNSEAANSTRTDFLYQNGGLGLDLSGDGLNVGLWEVGGSPLTTHVEFMNNSQSKIIISDGVSNQTTFHATHVAGTLAANGNNTNAKGMAPESTILSFDAVDDQVETLNQATNEALLLSNHSYGIPVSSSNGNSPSNLMGTYNSDARAWDLIAESAPYFLSVFSAGNDGNVNYNGGTLDGYDKLTGEKNSKNNLVVANANNIFINSNGTGELITATINASSSQGPSDDGRIKPDITGLGTQILSTSNTSNNSYSNSTGTSMSAPNVAGSLLLLQEHYNNVNNNFMKSSTLKAVSLITADDAGNIGPDAIFGWGILNSKKSIELINQSSNGSGIVKEKTLNNNQSINFDIIPDGQNKLKVGIVWTDPAGLNQTGSTNSTVPALINDLDIRVYDDNNNEYLPWKLNINNVAGSAIKGDNTVDNVEVIQIDFPSTTPYNVIINHKGNLENNQQDVSIVATGVNSHTLSQNNFEVNKQINIWPNPTSDSVNITTSINSEINYIIYDLKGSKLSSGVIRDGQKQINIQSYRDGVYFIKLTSGYASIVKKIIKK